MPPELPAILAGTWSGSRKCTLGTLSGARWKDDSRGAIGACRLGGAVAPRGRPLEGTSLVPSSASRPASRTSAARQGASVDPEGLGLAHVEVHEGAVRVVAAAGVAQRAAVVPERLVGDAADAEIERATEVVVRVRRVLRGRVGAVAADDLERLAAEVARDVPTSATSRGSGGCVALPSASCARRPRGRWAGCAVPVLRVDAKLLARAGSRGWSRCPTAARLG